MSLDVLAHDDIASRIVRYGELIPCRSAFIDAHTPGSDKKENFTIIGGGVSESPDQHVHIAIPHGFNIGAAGQPPGCTNSLHSHRTAEVFFVLTGRWRFFWGRQGDAGDVILEPGDIINIPTGMFRGFENVGTDYGMIMAVLGGDDAGGGVIWAPEVLEDARDHGLVLSNRGRLYDTERGESLPANESPMAPPSGEELADFAEPSAMQMVGGYVRRYWDMVALAAKTPLCVIGERGIIRDRPGFEVGFMTGTGCLSESITLDRPHVLMPAKGHWRISWDDGDTVLAPGDTMSVPAGLAHRIRSAMSGESALYTVTATDDTAGDTWRHTEESDS